MALQGTLDTFALPDVLRLLASTKKTGRLRLTGDRGSGSLWVDVGLVVDAESTGAVEGAGPAGVLFELLRYADGSFTFEAGATSSNAGAAADVEPLIVDAERQLEEWRDIEVVVPSLDAWVSLVPELPGDDVVLDAYRWNTIVAVGSGSTVAAMAEALGLTEVPACRVVKELVELGLGAVAVGAASETAASPVVDEPVPEIPVAPPEMPAFETTGSNGFRVASLESDPEPMSFLRDVEAGHELYVSEFGSNPEEVGQDLFPSPSSSTPPPPPPPPPPPAPTTDVDDEVDAEEVARQLATLSPKAARAVAAAARAETDDEREAALAEAAAADDTPINRGLLLKFLGSVKS